jgi:hypothetical protein
LIKIAAMTPVPQEQDFGNDYFCEPRVSLTSTTETVSSLCLIQVKGGCATLTYGGLDRKKEWMRYELDWLISLAAPLFLAHVDRNCTYVDLYSLWQMWWIFMQAGMPYQIICRHQPASEKPYDWKKPTDEEKPEGKGNGDGKMWTVELGPPFLRLTAMNLRDSEFSTRAAAILNWWSQWDRITLLRLHQGVRVLNAPMKWSTNSMGFAAGTLMAWNWQPGVNLQPLLQAFVPVLVNLGVHLQWQDNMDAYKLIPILQWMNKSGQLDELGKGLLKGLRETKAAGESPAARLSLPKGPKA